jgi:hypothetical protein
MKNCPAFIGIFLFLLMSASIQAQTFGFRGGLNLATMVNKNDIQDFGEDFSMSPGLLLGGVFEFPISSFFSVESGVLLSTKGYKLVRNVTENGVTLLDIDQKATLYYLDVPVSFKAYQPIGDARLFASAGPYLSFGISGKYRSRIETINYEEDIRDEVKWGSDNGDFYRRFDYGLTGGIGIAFRTIELAVRYQYGLANISPNQDFGHTINNRVLSFTLGFRM